MSDRAVTMSLPGLEVVSLAPETVAAPDGRIIIGDNLRALTRAIEPESVDCVYIDPPFNSGRDYRTTGTVAGAKPNTVAFTDTFRWTDEAAAGFEELTRDPSTAAALRALDAAYGPSPLLAYAVFMAPRLVALNRVLKPSGYLWVHCDDSASFALAIMLDCIFGPGERSRSFFWRRTLGSHSGTKRSYGRVHDIILMYPKERHLRRNANPKSIDFSDIEPLGASSKERTGYPTQKPVALLRRIIGLCTSPGDLVLDAFMGSGTTIVAAHEMGRRWIGLDLSPIAEEVTRARLAAASVQPIRTKRRRHVTEGEVVQLLHARSEVDSAIARVKRLKLPHPVSVRSLETARTKMEASLWCAARDDDALVKRAAVRFNAERGTEMPA